MQKTEAISDREKAPLLSYMKTVLSYSKKCKSLRGLGVHHSWCQWCPVSSCWKTGKSMGVEASSEVTLCYHPQKRSKKWNESRFTDNFNFMTYQGKYCLRGKEMSFLRVVFSPSQGQDVECWEECRRNSKTLYNLRCLASLCAALRSLRDRVEMLRGNDPIARMANLIF